MSTGTAPSLLYVATSAIADRQRDARDRSQVAIARRTRALARPLTHHVNRRRQTTWSAGA